jgi:nicotinamidase-related amidase
MHNRPDHIALLVMDVQNAITGMLKDSRSYFQCLNDAIQAAREQGIPVIFAVIGFRKGYPEISAGNKSFSTLKDRLPGLDSKEASTVHAAIAPLPDEVIITKKRVSAFMGSDLEVVLRSRGIEHLVLTGIATSGVVLSTLREAADKDYRLTVLADCCADRDEEVHRMLTTKVFPLQAEVLEAKQWCERLKD